MTAPTRANPSLPSPTPPLRPPAPKRPGTTFGSTFQQIYRTNKDLGEAIVGGALASLGDHLERKHRHTLVPPKTAPSPIAAPRATSRPPEVRPAEGPLEMRTADELAHSNTERVALPEDWRAFLGDVGRPFRMLVWGLPGNGKSTFVLQLLDALNAGSSHNGAHTLYVSGEEGLNSTTLRSRVARTMTLPQKTLLLPRLPRTAPEWKQAIFGRNTMRTVMAVDSLNALEMSPRALSASLLEAVRVEDERVPSPTGPPPLPDWELAMLKVLPSILSQVWIAYARKDGHHYHGESSWAHDADIVVRCERGVATTVKNRFAPAGRTREIYPT